MAIASDITALSHLTLTQEHLLSQPYSDNTYHIHTHVHTQSCRFYLFFRHGEIFFSSVTQPLTLGFLPLINIPFSLFCRCVTCARTTLATLRLDAITGPRRRGADWRAARRGSIHLPSSRWWTSTRRRRSSGHFRCTRSKIYVTWASHAAAFWLVNDWLVQYGANAIGVLSCSRKYFEVR